MSIASSFKYTSLSLTSITTLDQFRPGLVDLLEAALVVPVDLLEAVPHFQPQGILRLHPLAHSPTGQIFARSIMILKVDIASLKYLPVDSQTHHRKPGQSNMGTSQLLGK